MYIGEDFTNVFQKGTPNIFAGYNLITGTSYCIALVTSSFEPHLGM